MGTMNLEMPQDGVFTEAELAAFLKCTRAALRRMRREHRGPRWTRVGRLVRYPGNWIREGPESNEGGQDPEGRR